LIVLKRRPNKPLKTLLTAYLGKRKKRLRDVNFGNKDKCPIIGAFII